MAKKQPGTNLVQFDEELAKQAQAYRQTEAASATGNFIGTAAGILSWRGAPIEGNKMDCIVLTSVFENDYYKDAFDKDNPTPPACYAFATSQDALAPHESAEDKQGDANGLCAGCWANGFGSAADGGRGKACQNRRRLAVIPASGKLTAEGVKTAELAYFRVPVLSVAGFSNHVMQVADLFKRPPFGVVTELSLVPDAKSQFRALFKIKAPIEDREALTALMARSHDAAAAIQFPYPKAAELARAPARRQPARRPPGTPQSAAKKQPQQRARDNALPTQRPAASQPRKF